MPVAGHKSTLTEIVSWQQFLMVLSLQIWEVINIVIYSTMMRMIPHHVM